MYQIDFSNSNKKIYFIGIGGISMSGLAELLIHKGYSISGSDPNETDLTRRLSSLGATVNYSQIYENITDDIDYVVMTAAIHDDNPELVASRAKKIPVLTRAELLGQIMKLYPVPVAVSGTHGKTTTTSMISEMLLYADYDPTLSIGGILPSIGGNFRIGGSDYFVTEACEYTNSFLSFFPTVEIILNIDADHLDFFKDLDDIRSSFKKFTKLLPDSGLLIVNGDMDKLSYITDNLNAKIITFGLSEHSKYRATNISYDNFARPTFTLLIDGIDSGKYSLGVTGEHNVVNSLSVIALGHEIGISDDIIKSSLLGFTGTDRRFQIKGNFNDVTVIDDYAHHPTEIEATLTSAQKYPHKTLWCIFQPHTYTRTKALMDEFARTLALADKIILADIYAARETDTLGISSETLAETIKKYNPNVTYLTSFGEIEKFCKKNCSSGDVLITMGAGDVVKIGENLVK